MMRFTALIFLLVPLLVAAAACGGGGGLTLTMYGRDMEPSIPTDTRMTVKEYGNERPARGHIIVFTRPDLPPDAGYFIKRVIAVSGETVEVRDGEVFIDGEPLDEPYIYDQPRYTYASQTVPPDNYFVLGDNRNNSADSHLWGMLPEEHIIGRVVDVE